MSAAILADDLFAGAGGWDVAAARLGIEARGVENMAAARATRDAAGLTTIHDDVWTFAPDGAATGLIASPPCQTFSAAGKGAGRRALDDVLGAIRRNDWISIERLHRLAADTDPRTALVLTPLHYALTGGYRWLAWEQVPTVRPVWEACAEKLRAYGWSAWTGVLNAEQYGVPQTRRRAVLIASLDAETGEPLPTHSRYYSRRPDYLDPGVPKWVSMAEALGWEGATGVMVSNYGTGGDSSKRGTRTLDQPAPAVTSKIDRNRIYADPDHWAFRRPSTTIVGSFKPEIVAAPGYRTTVRVTVGEAGILQSFAADYPWQGAKGRQFLQAGNAVPPLLAEHVLTRAAGIGVAGEVAA